MANERKSDGRGGGRTTLVSLQTASEETGAPYTSLRDLVIRGHLRRVHLGDSRRIWIRRADLEKLIGR
jgi:hypothetical protein